MYLQRFRAYSRAAAVPEREQCDLLISLLDDRTLNGLSTLVNQGEYNMADLVTALRRAEGYNNNRERFITELRARKRLRNEDIWTSQDVIQRAAFWEFAKKNCETFGKSLLKQIIII